MVKIIKWGLIVGVGLLVLCIVALLVAPQFIDIQHYKPTLEQKVAETTGRPFSIGGDLQLSLFPSAGVSFSDLRLGNPEGFQEKDFIGVKGFDVKVKLIPLLSRDIQVERFIVREPRIVLETNKAGQSNWQGLAGSAGEEDKAAASAAPGPTTEEPTPLPLKSLAVKDFRVENGSALWIDQVKGQRNEISNLNLELKDVSLDRPIGIVLSAVLDQKPLALNGQVGPVGSDPGQGTIPIDITVEALKTLALNLKGRVVNPASAPQLDLNISMQPLSLRQLLVDLEQSPPLKTADPNVLNKVALKARVQGSPAAVNITDGLLTLDDSTLEFTLSAKDFDKPNIGFQLSLNEIDLDRYLPPPAPTPEAKPAANKPASAAQPIDYTPLRRMVLNGTAAIGRLKVQNMRVQDLDLKITGNKGVFNMDPLTLKLYEGSVAVNATLDVRQDRPKTQLKLQSKGIKVNPLLKDAAQKDFLEGTTQANLAVSTSGDDAERIKRSLNGSGELQFRDGAIVGVNLEQMVQNVQSAFGMAGTNQQDRPRTDFTELKVPFTLKQGVFNTPNSTMASPVLRIKANGDANLPQETLDFRVEPTFVSTIKGQDDTQQRTGLLVPVLVTGTFASPSFKPDLKGMVTRSIEGELPTVEDVTKKAMEGDLKKEDVDALKDKAKGILKSLPFGQQN